MASKRRNEAVKTPKIGIYTGRGASHSWLWFVEVFERFGFYDLRFLTENEIAKNRLAGLDVLAVSGGDTFAIAEALGPVGASRLKAFITAGGLYMGSCAGAYLPLNSSKEHLNHFNFVGAKITNLAKRLPRVHNMKEKFCTCYGCSFIYHAVREAVQVTTCGGASETFTAPLYGGPPMTVANPASVLATYTGFTDKTLFLVDRPLAEKTLLGNAAVIREKLGDGHLHLFGPHFEHPHFIEANRFLKKAMIRDLHHTPVGSEALQHDTEILEGTRKRRFITDFKRELSNSRIVAAGLEMVPLKWTIGSKVYETGKIRVFLEALWQRIRSFESGKAILVRTGQHDLLVKASLSVTQNIREIKKGWDRKTDTLDTATELFHLLNRISALFLEIYFRSKLFHLVREIEHERSYGPFEKKVA